MTKSDAIITALKEATVAGVDTDEALDQLGELVEQVHAKIAPTPVLDTRARVWSNCDVVLSEVPVGYQDKTCVVGWDTCGSCHATLKQCTCKNGPSEPTYVRKFRSEGKPALVSADAIEAKPFSQQISEKVLAEKGTTDVGTVDTGLVCATCKKPVTPDTADLNDDQKSYMCFECQIQS